MLGLCVTAWRRCKLFVRFDKYIYMTILCHNNCSRLLPYAVTTDQAGRRKKESHTSYLSIHPQGADRMTLERVARFYLNEFQVSLCDVSDIRVCVGVVCTHFECNDIHCVGCDIIIVYT